LRGPRAQVADPLEPGAAQGDRLFAAQFERFDRKAVELGFG
jgi:hypothetical protein